MKDKNHLNHNMLTGINKNLNSYFKQRLVFFRENIMKYQCALPMLHNGYV